jgi:hypothetical protein
MAEGWERTNELRWVMKYVVYDISPDGLTSFERNEKVLQQKWINHITGEELWEDIITDLTVKEEQK